MTVQPSPTRSARILFDTEVLETWHPLDGVPAPEYVPPTWDAPHVGRRLVDGLRTLMLMPRVRGPQAFGNAWPEYAHDWADLLAQQEADAEQKSATSARRTARGCGPPQSEADAPNIGQSMRNARWVYQGDIGLPLRFGRFQ
jgi:hypothetical protein